MGGRSGRDVFVCTQQAVEQVAAIVREAFGLAAGQVCLDTDPEGALFAAMRTGSWVRVSRLHPEGQFRVKLEIEVGMEVDTVRLDAMASRHGMLVAYAVDEDDPADSRYVLVGLDGRRTGGLAFREKGDEVVCDEVTAAP